MRYLFLIILCLLKTFHLNAQGKDHIILINPVGLIAPIFDPGIFSINLFYEKSITNNLSICTSIDYGCYYKSTAIRVYNKELLAELDYRGFGIMPELLFYLGKKDAPFGYYAGIFPRFNIVKQKYFEYSSDGKKIERYNDYGSFVGFGIKTGYKFGKRILFDPAINVGVGVPFGFKNDYDFNSVINTIDENMPIFFNLELKIGYMFKLITLPNKQ